MRNFLVVVLLALMSGPAFAYDTPRALLEALYAPYAQGDSYEWVDWDETQFRSAELNGLFENDAREADGEVGRLDFDPYIDGQDYQLSDLSIGAPQIAGDTATVEVSFSNFDHPETLSFALVREADGWKVDDVISADTDFPYSLKAILEAPLDQ